MLRVACVLRVWHADEGSFPEFNREGFLENAAKEVRPLLELITETQMFSMFIEQRGAAQIDNGVFDRGITGKSPDTEPAAVSSGEARTSQRMRPAHTRFTMYEYGNITRSEISAVHEMIREHTEKTKKVCRTRTTAHAHDGAKMARARVCRILTSRRAWSCFENGGRRRRGGRRAP